MNPEYYLLAAGGVVVVSTMAWLMSLRRVAKTNEVHIVRTGRHTNSYGKLFIEGEKQPKNSYYKIPEWVPVWGTSVTVLPTSILSRKLERYVVYDKDRVPFVVDITAFFYISDAAKASERISNMPEVDEQLDDIVGGAIKSVMAQSPLNEIMEEYATYGDKFRDFVSKDLKTEWGMSVARNVQLMNIDDVEPGKGPVADIMKKKAAEINRDSRVTIAKSNQEAREQEIESDRIVAVKEAEKEELIGKRNAEKDQAIGIAKEKSDQQVQEEAKLTAEKKLAVDRVQKVTNAKISQEAEIIEAETLKKKTIIEADQNKEKMVIDTEAEKEQVRIKTDARKYEVETLADAALAAAKKDADGVRAAKAAEAKGIEDVGIAAAKSEREMQLARVTAETTLAQQIGDNKGYQDYLVNLKQVEVSGEVAIKTAEFNAEVGKAQAGALEKADVKIVANTGGVQSGLKSLTDLFTSGGAAEAGAADLVLKNLTGNGAFKSLQEWLESFALAKTQQATK